MVVRPLAHACRGARSFSYDHLQLQTESLDANNGNLLTRTKGNETWNLKWTGFDKPRWMAKSTTTAGVTTTAGSEFHYNAARSRVLQLEFDSLSGAAPNQTPGHYTRKRLYGLGSTLEANYANVAPAGAPSWKLDTVRIYVPGPDGVIGAREFRPGLNVGGVLLPREKTLVYHYDHLGSVTAITPYGSTEASLAADSGGKPGNYSEDAWGQRRDPLDWLGAPVTTDDGGPDSLTPRGFTGHEMLDDLGLVHMNGRIYDPLLGRFLSADIVVQNPLSLQHYNRYSYVQNNPLTLVDPTGWYSILGLEFTDGGGVTGFVKDLGGYTADATTGAAGGLYDSTVGASVNAGNEAGQMYIDSRESGSGGLASFGYATSMGLGRMSGGTGLVEFYSGEKIQTGTDGSLKQGEFNSVADWAVHGAASYVQAGTTAVGIKSLAARVGEAAPKARPPGEVPQEPANPGPCFAAGTLVQTPDGMVPIEEIEAGDVVLALDFDAGQVTERRVLETVQNWTDYWVLVSVEGEEVKATRTHRFWVESESAWLPALDLKAGMIVRLADGRLAPIDSTRLVALQSSERTFNLGVEKDHNYFVGRSCVLVHNGGPSEEELKRIRQQQGPNGGQRPPRDQQRVERQRELRNQRRESQSRAENGQNQSGEGFRSKNAAESRRQDQQNSRQAERERNVKENRSGREKNVGIDEEHSMRGDTPGKGGGRKC